MLQGKESDVRLLGRFWELVEARPLGNGQPGSSTPTHCTSSEAQSWVGTRIDQVEKPLNLGLPTIQFSLADELKYVKRQDNIGELCKTMRDLRDNKMELPSEVQWKWVKYCCRNYLCKVQHYQGRVKEALCDGSA